MRILLLHSNLNQMGGAEYYSYKVIDALIGAGHHVSVLHLGGPINVNFKKIWPDLSRVDGLDILKVPKFLVKFFSKRHLNLLCFSVVLFLAKFHYRKYDFLISTYGECYFKNTRQLNIIHVPLFLSDETSLSYLGFSEGGVKGVGRAIYVKLCRVISSWNKSLIAGVPSFANSNWTANAYCSAYGAKLKPDTLYIGASSKSNFEHLTFDRWCLRRNRISILGRIVPSKRIEMAIDIVARLRAGGFEVGLDIVGNGSGAYFNQVKECISKYPWIKMHASVSREDLEGIISSNKWGIHCAKFEHYGIAAVELQRLGCITLVPNSSGQAEVASTPFLTYSGADDAENKLIQLMSMDKVEIEALLSLRQALVNSHDSNQFSNRLWSLISSSDLRPKP